MKTAVFYNSKTGNTKKVAEAIAEAAGCGAEPLSAGKAEEKVDLLFLGAAVYATSDHNLAPEVKAFVRALDPGKVGKAAVFCTGFAPKAGHILKGLLKGRGIEVSPEVFYCKGRFLLFMAGHPDGVDLSRAGDFARKAIREAGAPAS